MSATSRLRIGVARDLALSALVTGLIIGSWSLVLFFFGDYASINDSLIAFAGGTLTVTGLLFRQYMLKEVLEYYAIWSRIVEVIEEIETSLTAKGVKPMSSAMNLAGQKPLARRYCAYLKAELSIIPLIPIAVIFLFGCAILASQSPPLRVSCLSAMLYLVVYLSIAAVTSSNIACSLSEPQRLLQELEGLITGLSSEN